MVLCCSHRMLWVVGTGVRKRQAKKTRTHNIGWDFGRRVGRQRLYDHHPRRPALASFVWADGGMGSRAANRACSCFCSGVWPVWWLHHPPCGFVHLVFRRDQSSNASVWCPTFGLLEDQSRSLVRLITTAPRYFRCPRPSGARVAGVSTLTAFWPRQGPHPNLVKQSADVVGKLVMASNPATC